MLNALFSKTRRNKSHHRDYTKEPALRWFIIILLLATLILIFDTLHYL